MKYEILKMLKESAPGFVSGEVLSKRLDVSRTVVWKCIGELKGENYKIESSSKKGYRLAALPEEPNGFEIGYGLGTGVIGREIFYYDKLDSTNTLAKKLAAEGCIEGTVVAAGSQTAGRGRLGRTWESPEGKGIYLSVVLRPAIAPSEIHIITIAASLAAARAIDGATGLESGIKWPNDILAGGKKICGILTEMNCETDRVNYAVCGIGINYSQMTGDFPEELKDRATSVLSLKASSGKTEGMPADAAPGRLELIRSLLRELDLTYAAVTKGMGQDIVRLWKSRSLTLGKEISFSSGGGTISGRAIDITGEGRLVVECDGGGKKEILSGEVSVRGL